MSPEHFGDANEGVDRKRALDTHIDRLGFVESELLSDVRRAAVEAYKLKDVPTALTARDRYIDLGQQMVENMPGDQQAGLQLGLNLAAARLWHECGDQDRYIQCLEDCWDDADGQRNGEVCDLLDWLLSARD